ncbi:unnamed protein product, partial [Rotaria sp. Silwood2]
QFINDKLASSLETLKRRAILLDRLLKIKQQQQQQHRVNHFGEYISSDNGDIRRMIGASLPYSQREFNQSEYSRHENNNSFEFISASNMIRYSSLLREISPCINRNLPITNIMLDMENNLLSYHFLLPKKCSIYLWKQCIFSMILIVVTYTLQLKLFNIYVYFSADIAFNKNDSLFLNVCYFEQVFAGDLLVYVEKCRSPSSSGSILYRIVNFQFMVIRQ